MQGIPEVVIVQQVYANGGKYFVKDKTKGYKGLSLWKEVTHVIGKIYVTTGNQFYLDETGFSLV